MIQNLNRKSLGKDIYITEFLCVQFDTIFVFFFLSYLIFKALFIHERWRERERQRQKQTP